MTSAPTPPHRVEDLLAQAFSDEAALRNLTLNLMRRGGLAADDLPNCRALRCLALLGDHMRADVITTVRSQWDDLTDRGLVSEHSPEELSTPHLRLLAYTLPLLGQIEPLQEVLRVDEAPAPMAGMFVCAQTIQGVHWGQPLSIQFSCNRMDGVRIHGDPLFDLEPVLLRSSGDHVLHGELDLLADTGSVYFTMRSDTGDVYQHVLSITTAKSLEEMV